MKSGATASKYDQAIFIWCFGNKLSSVIVAYVDNFCFEESEIFQTRIINSFHHVFVVKCEEVAKFQYIGLDIKNNGENIKLGQNEYVKKLKYILIEAARNLKDAISTIEITETRQIIGQLSWLATQTQSDLSYSVSALSSILKQEDAQCIKLKKQKMKNCR